MRKTYRGMVNCGLAIVLLTCWPAASLRAQNSSSELNVKIDPADGSYAVGAHSTPEAALKAGIAAEIDGRWVESKDYPHHTVKQSSVSDDLGPAQEWAVTFSGLKGEPDLHYRLRTYADKPFADIQVSVDNTTAKSVEIEAIRPVAAMGTSILNLGGPVASDRILSDSFSEDRPGMELHDFGKFYEETPNLYRAVGSQLVYNRQSGESLFIGALTSDRFLTVMRIHVVGDAGDQHISAFEVDSTGTTELELENSLRDSPQEDRIALKLPLAPGAQMDSERLLFSAGKNYHRQLETYAHIIRQLHHPRISAPSPLGWWSWTAYYFGLSSGTALTNAEWEAQHLKKLGYDFFHIDEGYQYARGEYTTPNATLFPKGMAPLEKKAAGMGLVPGIWTAPFEVSERSWVYQKHPDWLIHNAQGKPIPAGWVSRRKDQLYMLDCTNPGAQKYLYQTYSTMAHDWGIRYIKLDFMDDSAIEGYYYRPHTTAMEAQRIGLGVIRKAVGENVLLDKDGSVMLNPIGYVDFGRISQDTGHAFARTKEAAPGVAARYYMNRNYFVADPDAFSVSEETIGGESRRHNAHPLTLDEAKVSIALSAVAGGMYEDGDDLPIVGSEPERLALLENQDLINMARLGRSSTPVDLMTYLPEDQQPSIFLLKESPRQSILTIFNWTENPRTHSITPASLGLNGQGPYTATGVFSKEQLVSANPIVVEQPPHSVRVLKIIDTSVPAQAPQVHADHPSSADTGQSVTFTASTSDSGTPTVAYRWDFGDGVSAEGPHVSHAYTHPGNYLVTLRGNGVDGLPGETQFHLAVSGTIPTMFDPANIRRGTASQ